DGNTSDCDSPFEIDLVEGAHHFEVRAQQGLQQSTTPATFDWAIDTTPPKTAIVSGPPALDNTPTEMIAFTGSDGAVSFECALDAASFAACTSPVTLTPGDGAHAFVVRAKDAAGNVDPAPPTHAWTLDTALPDTAIASGPDEGATTGPSVQIAFTSPVTGATFECSLDSAAFATCTSPVSLAGLGDGAHAFAVRAKDDHGVVDPSPATRTWTVDAVPPPVSIDTHPNDPTNQV